VLADIARAGGWQVVIARIASGESVAGIGRSFGVSRSFFSSLLHEDRDRHALVAKARRRASGREPLAEIAALLDRFARPTAAVAARPVEAEVEPDREIR
jgi:hypothetical protein